MIGFRWFDVFFCVLPSFCLRPSGIMGLSLPSNLPFYLLRRGWLSFSINEEITTTNNSTLTLKWSLWFICEAWGFYMVGQLESWGFMTHRWMGIATIERLRLPTTLSVAILLSFFRCLFQFSSNSQPCQPPATLPCTLKWSNPFGSALTTKTLQNTKLFWKHLIYRCAMKPENSKVQRHPYKKLPNQGL